MENGKKDPGIYIVLVDDETRIHEMIKEIFQASDNVEIFESYFDPASFLEQLKTGERKPDMVLLDVHFENSGLTGIDILPFIKEEDPYLPVVLLTGMEGEEIADAQDFECTYYIPKPISPENLERMVTFYLGKGRKSGKRIEKLSKDLDDLKTLLDLLEEELKETEKSRKDDSPDASGKEVKVYDRLFELLLSVLKNCDVMPSFSGDIKKLYNSDFKLLKRVIENITQLDSADLSSPGSNIHKYYGVENIYSYRISKKVRLFFFLSQKTRRKRLLRIDPEHDTKRMDKWLKANAKSYED